MERLTIHELVSKIGKPMRDVHCKECPLDGVACKKTYNADCYEVLEEVINAGLSAISKEDDLR